MNRFEAMRRLATTLGVAGPESDDDVFNVKLINSIGRAAKNIMRDAEQVSDNKKIEDKLIFIGYTNGIQISYASDDEGSFYNTTEEECYIPIYMLKTHAHRLETTSAGSVTLESLKATKDTITIDL